MLSGTPSATQTAGASYTYKVEDSDGDEASDVFTIAVEDDSTPTVAATSDQTWVKSNAVSLTLPAASNGNSPLTYSLAGDLPTGVSFNATTRVLSGTPSATQTAASYTYKVEDSDGDEASDVFTIAVEDDSTPTLAATSDQTWVKSNAVSLTLPAASNGNSPLTYSLGGDLPTGVSFNTTTRVLSGTPSATQTAASYTYKVEDSDGDEASDVFTITVEDDTSPTLAATADQAWIKDTAVSLTLPAASSGNSPLTYSLAGDLPTGVSFNATTRVLSGTPSATQTATSYTYKVEDSDGDEASDVFTITVEDDTSPTLAATADQAWIRQDTAVSLTLPAASSGNSPLTYSLAGDLPTGVSFNATTRVLSGTPSATQTAATLHLQGRGQRRRRGQRREFTITVEDDTSPTLAATSDQTWVKSNAVSLTLPAAANGNSPLTYSLAGDLPTGVSFNTTTRVLSGTPSATQTAASYTYKVEDSDGDEASDVFTITVEDDTSPTLAATADQSWIKGAAVALTLPTASSGNSPLTYSLAGSPPTGVSFDTGTRVLSGTPSATQTATTYTYKVEDANGDEATDEFTVTVEDDTSPSLAATADQSWIKGTAVSLTLPAASNGNAPLTYSLAGTPPTGVSFNASTRVLSGTPSATQTATTYTYKVEDANGDEATDEFTIAVEDDTSPTLAATTDQSWFKGTAVSLTLSAASNGNAPLTYSLAGTLPNGVSFNTSTRVLSGTPSATQVAASYTYKVRDRNGDEASDIFTIAVYAPLTLSGTSDFSWVKDVAKTVTLPAASGGVAPLTYSLVGAPPPGLNFTASTRVLSGTASAVANPATYIYKVRAANGDEASDVFTIQVLAESEQSQTEDDRAKAADSDPADSDPCAVVPRDTAPTQPTLDGVPFLPAGPAVVSGNAELRVRLPSARTSALAPVFAWNFKLDHYKDESQLGTWIPVPEVWLMQRAIAVTVNDSPAQPAASGASTTVAESLDKDLIFSRMKVPVTRGSAASYVVRLATQPTADVTVTVAGTSESVGGLTASPAQLTFSTSDWNHSQVVTVTASAAEGEYRQATIGHTASGGGYDGVSGQVTAQETDASAKALTMSANELEVGEGSTVTYTVHLAAKPSSDVVLTIERTGQADLSVDADPLAEGAQNSLTFTTANWNVLRTITVTAGQDENAVNETAQLELALSGDGFGKRIGGLENAKSSSACGSVYLVSVQAVNRLGASAYSTAVQATPTTVTPPAPANLQAAPGAGEIALSWSDPEDDSITGYEYRYTSYAGTSSESRGQSSWQVLETTTRHVVGGMRFGVRYTFEVRALQGEQRGAISRATAIPALADAVSRAPTGFAATWTATAEGQLQWDADPVATSYEYRHSGDDGATWTDWQDAVATCDEASCSTTVTVSGNPEAFEFELRRRSILNPDIARARTGTHPRAPKAPLLVASNTVGPTPVDQWQLTWTTSTVGEPVTGWQYRSVYLGNPSGSLWTAWTDMQPSTDEGVLSFTVMLGSEDSKGQRMFQVRGTNSAGVGEPSNAR